LTARPFGRLAQAVEDGLLADKEEELRQSTPHHGLLGESEQFALDMLNLPIGQLSQLGWTNARIVAYVLERLDVELDAHLIEEIDVLQAEHVDPDGHGDDGEEDDGDEEDEGDPGEEIAIMPQSSGLVSESVHPETSSLAGEVKSLQATSVEYALDGFRTNVSQLLLLKMPLMDVFKALSDATTNPWNDYERSTDPKSPAHLEELRDDLDQFAQCHLMGAVRAMQRVGQSRFTIVYMVERNLMSRAERQLADDAAPAKDPVPTGNRNA
jgi:hypothetical protein